VEQEEGEQLTRAHHMITFMEVSSKSNVNVENAFYQLASHLKSQYDQGNLSEAPSRFDAFRLKYPDTTAISSRWLKCSYCNY
jgi:Ras family